MHRALVISSLLLMGGCAPQNASLTGDYTAYLSDVAAITLQRGNLKLSEFSRRFNIDCREFATARSDEENESLRLSPREQVCRGDVDEEGNTVGRDDWPPQHEVWIEDDGYVVVGDTFEPWRGEGIITSEGDVQLGFHQRLPGGEDFRFAFVIDPDFQPSECAQNEAGDGVVFQDIDGDWVAEWSNELDEDEEGTLYFLNASSYQFNPNPNEDANNAAAENTWFLPNEWLAGSSRGKFADDEFRHRPARFGTPELYLNFDEEEASGGTGTVVFSDLFLCEWDEDADPDQVAYENCRAEKIERAQSIADNVVDEFEHIGLPVNAEGLPSMRPRVHTNAWRTVDGNAGGLDGWVELHYSWVRFDPGSELETGGAASGEFNIVFDGIDSPSRFFVRGSFKVDRFKRDRWTTDYLPAVKFEENGTTFCGTTVEPPDNF
jgi:hypothetical protein